MTTMGERLTALRKQKGITQDEAGKHIGAIRQTIWKYEKDKVNIPSTMIAKLAQLYNVSPAYILTGKTPEAQSGVSIPLVGRVPAGVPIAAAEDIIGYEEISHRMADQGEHFALKIQGESMEPDIKDGDIVIIRKQKTFENGDICVVLVNGYEATVKQVRKSKEGLQLIAFNPLAYSTTTYTPKEIEQLPVLIIGRVIEIRRTL